jgi:ABC-type transport system involved in cytochrome c biogenesis permease subunit
MSEIEISTVFLGIIASILIAGVPWAYSVHGRLSKIETKLQVTLSVQASLHAIEGRVSRVETNVAVLQSHERTP